MRPIYALACLLAILPLPALIGCGAAGINPVPSGTTSNYAGSYNGAYTGINNERGTMVANISTNGTIAGTITNTVPTPPLSGPLAGVVTQDGKFKLYYHYANDTIVYSGTGIITRATTTSTGTGTGATATSGTKINGTWNLTTPASAATTLTFVLNPQ